MLLLASCTSAPQIEGFNKDAWTASALCSEERIALARLVMDNEEKLLSYTQPEVEALLGSAPRHELHGRNEKFFFYPIAKNCPDSVPDQSLFVRFDALGRAKEVLILLD